MSKRTPPTSTPATPDPVVTDAIDRDAARLAATAEKLKDAPPLPTPEEAKPLGEVLAEDPTLGTQPVMPSALADYTAVAYDRGIRDSAEYRQREAEELREGKPGGPTIEEWCAHGYDPAEYPGMGYAAVPSVAFDEYKRTGIVPQDAINVKYDEGVALGVLPPREPVTFRAPTCNPRHVPNCECTGDARAQP